jgi:hypothetical protein
MSWSREKAPVLISSLSRAAAAFAESVWSHEKQASENQDSIGDGVAGKHQVSESKGQIP